MPPKRIKIIISFLIVFYHYSFLISSTITNKYDEIKRLHSMGILAVSIMSVPEISYNISNDKKMPHNEYKAAYDNIMKDLLQSTFPLNGFSKRDKGISVSILPPSEIKKGMTLYQEKYGGVIGILVSPAKNNRITKNNLLVVPFSSARANNFKYNIISSILQLHKNKNIPLSNFILRAGNKNHFHVKNNSEKIIEYNVCKKSDVEFYAKIDNSKSHNPPHSNGFHSISWENFLKNSFHKDTSGYYKFNEVKVYKTNFSIFLGILVNLEAWKLMFYKRQRVPIILDIIYDSCLFLHKKRDFISPIMVYKKKSN